MGVTRRSGGAGKEAPKPAAQPVGPRSEKSSGIATGGTEHDEGVTVSVDGVRAKKPIGFTIESESDKDIGEEVGAGEGGL